MPVNELLFSCALALALGVAPRIPGQTIQPVPEPSSTLPRQHAVLLDTTALPKFNRVSPPECPMPVAHLGEHSGDSAMVSRVHIRDAEPTGARLTCINPLDPWAVPRTLSDTARVRRVCLEPERVLGGNKECVLRDQKVIVRPIKQLQ